MFFVKIFIICLAYNSSLFSFCSSTPLQQYRPYSQPLSQLLSQPLLQQPYSNPLCHEGYSFHNGMCNPINCPATHVMQNNMCVLNTINVAHQPAQCSTSCCQSKCQPPCQQPCPVQMPMQMLPMPMPMPIPVQIPVQVPVQTPVQNPVQIPVPVTVPVPMPCPDITTPKTQENTTPKYDKKCPEGTILINGYCHLIYCGDGIYRDGRCIVTECPEGTIWNGRSCQIPEAHNHTTVVLSTVVITNNVNQSQTNHSINYTNDLVITITESPSEGNPDSPTIVLPPPPLPQVNIISPPPPPPPVQLIPPPPPPPPPPQFIYVPARPQPPPPPPQPPRFVYIPSGPPLPPPPPPQVPIMVMPPPQPQPVVPNCCTINTPNTCLWEDRYVCRSHSYQQCGSICSHGNHLNLMPQIVKQPPLSCINSDCGYNHQPFYPDCSRCINGDMMTASYCQTYCSQNRACEDCKSFDLSRYCESYPAAVACRPEYGYTENFSDNFYNG